LKVLSDGRQTNFQGQGRQGGKRMNGFQKFALAASWVIALGAAVLAFSARREAQAATAAAKKAAAVPAAIAGARAGVRDNGGGVRQADDVQVASAPQGPAFCQCKSLMQRCWRKGLPVFARSAFITVDESANTAR